MIRVHLNELTRTSLMSKSKKETPDRFAHRDDSGNDWYLDRVGLLELESGSDDLYLYFKVKSKYRVSLVFLKFRPIIESYLNGKFKNDPKKAVTKALNYAIKNCHIKTSCDCPDYKYRFAYMATKRGYSHEDNLEDRPAKVRNPKNKGGLCKHQLRVLSLPSLWKPKVITSLKNYFVRR